MNDEFSQSYQYEQFSWWIGDFNANDSYRSRFNGVAYWLNELGGLGAVW